MDVPGLAPRSPVRMLDPVFVTVDLARTAKLPAEPKLIAAWAPDQGLALSITTASTETFR